MVQQSPTLDRAFAALADPNRRHILERLGTGPVATSDLAVPLDMTVTGVGDAALEDARLVSTQKVGRVRWCRLAPASSFDEAANWIDAAAPRARRPASTASRSPHRPPGGTAAMSYEIRVERLLNTTPEVAFRSGSACFSGLPAKPATTGWRTPRSTCGSAAASGPPGGHRRNGLA